MKYNLKWFKFFTILVLLAFTASFTPRVAEAQGRNQQSQPAPKAFLINSATGERIELPVEVHAESLGNGKFVTTYASGVSFDSPNYIPDVLPANTKSDCHWDTSYSVQSCMNAYYSEAWYSGQYAVSIDHYSYQWNRYDSQVAWSGAYGRATCYGYFEPHSLGICSGDTRVTVGSPSSGSWYTLYPSWRGKYVDIAPSEYQVGHMWVHLTRGSTGWDFGWCMSVGGGGSGCY